MVLLATAGRMVSFLMANEIYARPSIRWVFQSLRCIPVRRKTHDIGAVRAMLHVLERGGVVGLFPEGGLDLHRDESGYPGVGYLALKTGAHVVPASVMWANARPLTIRGTLFTRCRADVKYGPPIGVQQESTPTRGRIQEITAAVMESIQRLTADVWDQKREESYRVSHNEKSRTDSFG